MSYSLSKKAEEDIIAIYLEGASQFGTRQADHYHQKLEEAFRFLADNPEAARQRTELNPPVRFHPFKSHIILYTANEKGEVFIVRIRHGHEDWIK
jgi:toxin ParE1/3/4